MDARRKSLNGPSKQDKSPSALEKIPTTARLLMEVSVEDESRQLSEIGARWPTDGCEGGSKASRGVGRCRR